MNSFQKLLLTICKGFLVIGGIYVVDQVLYFAYDQTIGLSAELKKFKKHFNDLGLPESKNFFGQTVRLVTEELRNSAAKGARIETKIIVYFLCTEKKTLLEEGDDLVFLSSRFTSSNKQSHPASIANPSKSMLKGYRKSTSLRQRFWSFFSKESQDSDKKNKDPLNLKGIDLELWINFLKLGFSLNKKMGQITSKLEENISLFRFNKQDPRIIFFVEEKLFDFGFNTRFFMKNCGSFKQAFSNDDSFRYLEDSKTKKKVFDGFFLEMKIFLEKMKNFEKDLDSILVLPR